MLRRLMAAESMYYESLASARYVEGERNQAFQGFARSENAVLVVWMGGDIKEYSEGPFSRELTHMNMKCITKPPIHASLFIAEG